MFYSGTQNFWNFKHSLLGNTLNCVFVGVVIKPVFPRWTNSEQFELEVKRPKAGQLCIFESSSPVWWVWPKKNKNKWRAQGKNTKANKTTENLNRLTDWQRVDIKITQTIMNLKVDYMGRFDINCRVWGQLQIYLDQP